MHLLSLLCFLNRKPHSNPTFHHVVVDLGMLEFLMAQNQRKQNLIWIFTHLEQENLLIPSFSRCFFQICFQFFVYTIRIRVSSRKVTVGREGIRLKKEFRFVNWVEWGSRIMRTSQYNLETREHTPFVRKPYSKSILITPLNHGSHLLPTLT